MNSVKYKHAQWKHQLKVRYGITPEEYNSMVEEQNGVCAICGEAEASRPRLSVDHDHETGKIRGLLCTRCNVALGMLRDNVETATSLVSYLMEQQ